MRVLLLCLCVAFLLAGCVGSRNAATQSWSGVAVAGESTFVGTREGRLIQLSRDSGIAQIAPYAPPEDDRREGFPAIYGTPAVADGRVFVGTYNGTVLSLDAADLLDAKEFLIDGNDLAKGIAGSIVPVEGRLVVVAAEDADEGRLYVLDADTLVERCRYPARNEDPVGQVWSTPVVHEGAAYFGDLSHDVHAVSIEDCRPVWDRPATLGGAVVAPPTIVDDTLYTGAFDRAFYAVSLRTGGVERLFEGGNWFWAGSATDGSRVYVPNMDGNVYAYDIAARRVVWTYPGETAAQVLSAPVLVGGMLIFASDAGVLTVLRARDGGREWDRRVGNDVRAPLATDGRLVFVHSLDETVRAVNIETKQLAWERRLDRVR